MCENDLGKGHEWSNRRTHAAYIPCSLLCYRLSPDPGSGSPQPSLLPPVPTLSPQRSSRYGGCISRLMRTRRTPLLILVVNLNRKPEAIYLKWERAFCNIKSTLLDEFFFSSARVFSLIRLTNLTQGERDLTQRLKEMRLAKKKQAEQTKWLLPESNNSPSNLFSQLINSQGIRERCFPIILPQENTAGGWRLTFKAQHRNW